MNTEMNTDAPILSPSYQIENDQLDLLESLLDDPIFQDGAMRLDEIQGFLCAAFSGPSPMDEEDWLAEIFGSEELADSEPGQKAADILRRFAHALKTGLESGALPVLLLYPKDDDATCNDYLPWCQAYLSGVDTAAQDWFEFLGDGDGNGSSGSNGSSGGKASDETEYLDERLFALMVLSGEAKAAAQEHEETWPEGEELDELENQCQEDLPQVVVDIYAFWNKE